MQQIIRSPLDTDFYKFTMLGFIWSMKEYRNLPVRFTFKNRSHGKFPLPSLVNMEDLKSQFDALPKIGFYNSEADYVVSQLQKYHPSYNLEEFKKFLLGLRLPGVKIRQVDDDYEIWAEGPWAETTLCETFVLSIVTELVGRSLAKAAKVNHSTATFNGALKFIKKVKLLKEFPNLKIIEFGTRRRFSKELQEFIVWHALQYMPKQILGTSNVLFAKKLNLEPKGTMAHELLMAPVASAVSSGENPREAHMKVFDQWYETYGFDLSIALDDTYGSDAFREDFGSKRAALWKGYRPDSGDPIAEGYKIIKFLRKKCEKECELEPYEKVIFFADGMNPEKMIACHKHFQGRVRDIYGPGTNFTNDVGLPTLSLVMKLTKVKDQGTVKLSNNLAKATGKPEDIEAIKRAFNYTNNFYEKCKY